MTSAVSLSVGIDDRTQKAMDAVMSRVNAFAAKSQKSMAGAAGPVSKGMDQAAASIDNVTAKFEALRKRVETAMAPIRKLQASLAKLRDASGLTRIASGFGGIARAGSNAYQKVSQLIPLLGIVGSAASVAGITRLTDAWAEWGLKINNTAQRIGIAGSRLSDLQGAGRLGGSSGDAMSAGLQGIGQAMFDAQGGRNTEAIVMMRTLKLTTNEMKDSESALMAVADRIHRTNGHPYVQSRIVSAFNIPDELLPAMRKNGAAGIREYMEEARRLNPVTASMIAAAERLQQAQSRVSLATEGLRNRIAERLEPVLTPMLNQFSNWIATSPMIAQGIQWLGNAVQRLGEWIKSIDWDKVSERLGDWGQKLKSFLALMQRMGILPDLSDIGIGEKQRPPQLPPGSPLATPDNPAAPAGPDTRTWYERLYKPGPGLLSGFSSGNPQAPNGAPPVGPRFGPQQQSRTFDTTMTPEARGLLDTIAGTESPGYNVEYGGKRFSDYSQHPNDANPILSGPNAGQSSTAAGRYQFLKSTWDEAAAATGVKDFSPASQDKAAWWLAQRDYAARTNGRNLSEDLKSNDPQVRAGIGTALHGTWTSLPGGIEAGTNTSRFNTALLRNTERETMSVPAAQGAPMTLNTAGSGSNAGKDSTVRLMIEGEQGYRAKVLSNPQKVEVGGPLVERPGLVGNNP